MSKFISIFGLNRTAFFSSYKTAKNITQQCMQHIMIYASGDSPMFIHVFDCSKNQKNV